MIDVALIITMAWFCLYGLACSIECGVGINLLLDKNSASRRFFTPQWELTNVFLVFGFTALVVLFNGALDLLSRWLLLTVVVGAVFLLLRSAVVLYLFYTSDERFPLWGRWLFTVCNFGIPLSFVAAGIYMLTGQPFYSTATGIMAIVSSGLGLATIGRLFLEDHKDKKQYWSNLALFSAWFMVLGSFLPLAILYSQNGLNKWPILALDVLSVIGLLLAYLVISGKLKIRLKYYAAFVGLLAPLLLAWSNRPYLFRGQIKLADAYGAASYANAFLIGSAIILPVVLLGFWLFVKLVRDPAR